MRIGLRGIFSKNTGFTLVEMIIVIAIIGVITVVLTPFFTGYVEKSREATDENTIYEVMHAAETAYINDGKKAQQNVMKVFIRSNGVAIYGDSFLADGVKVIIPADSYVYKSKAYRGQNITITIDENGKASKDGPIPNKGAWTAADLGVDKIPFIGPGLATEFDEILGTITDEQWEDINQGIFMGENAVDKFEDMTFDQKIDAITGVVDDVIFPSISGGNSESGGNESEGSGSGGNESEGSGSDTCVATGSKVTLADGSIKKVEDLTLEDKILAFDHETGKYVEANILTIAFHGDNLRLVMNLEFSNGETVRLIDYHGLFDLTLNKYVYLTNENFTEFVGHEFAVQSEEGHTAAVLDKTYLSSEYVGAYAVVTDYYMNCYTNGILSIIPEAKIAVDAFEYDENLKYDAFKMQQDIETYGLYTYEDFAPFVSEEVFNLMPFKYVKVTEGKGLTSMEEVMSILEGMAGYLEMFSDEATYISDNK